MTVPKLASFDIAKFEAGLAAMAGIDFPAALEAFRSQNFDGELVAVEQALGVVAPFFPDVTYVIDGLQLLGFLNQTRELGYWTPGQPEDPAMMKAAGHSGGGR